MTSHMRADDLSGGGPTPTAAARTKDFVAGAGFEEEAGAARRLPTLAIVGLGYVGAVSAACFARLGYNVTGVDIDLQRVAAIAGGRSPMLEAGLGELLAGAVREQRLAATHDIVSAVAGADATLISVGTPSGDGGLCDLSFVEAASRGIGLGLAAGRGYRVVVLRCSVPPGTTLEVVAPILEQASGKRLGVDFGVAFCPEFLREGSAIADFLAPAKTVIGANDLRAAHAVRDIFSAISPDIVITSIRAAETVKYVDNVWHATKVVFANEVGRVCRSLDIDSHEVMDLFLRDTKLNVSAAYLRPGFAFGGSCLPKDVRAFARLASEQGVDVPLVRSLLPSNAAQVAEALRLIEPWRGKRIGILGLAFKPGTDDLRESPIIDVIGALLDRHELVRVHDESLGGAPTSFGRAQARQQSGVSTTRDGVVAALPLLAVSDAATLVAASDVVVVGHATDAYRKAVTGRPSGTHVIDLARLFRVPPEDATYSGISW